MFSGDDDDTIAIRHDHVSRFNQSASELDGTVHGFYLITSWPDSPADLMHIERYFYRNDLIGIPGRSIRNHAHATARNPVHDIV